MAYSTANPPRMAVPGVGLAVPSLWFYSSLDAQTVVRVDTYFSDAEDLGMKVGDVVIQTSADATVGAIYMVTAINADGSANLSDGTAIVATDSD